MWNEAFDPIGVESGKPTSPLDMDVLKIHLAIDGGYLDDLVNLYVDAAVDWAEDFMQRSIIAREHRYVLRDFPEPACDGYDSRLSEIRLPRGRTMLVDRIEYVGQDGAHTMNGPSGGSPGVDFQEDLSGESGGIIAPLPGRDWPIVACDVLAPVKIYFWAGWETAADVPAKIKQALMVAVADMLELRGTTDMQQLTSVLNAGKTAEFRESLLSDYVLRKP